VEQIKGCEAIGVDHRLAVDETGPHRQAFDAFDNLGNPGKTIGDCGCLKAVPD
jgi:hypothetical protein